MDARGSRPRAGVVASLPMSGLLVVFFFLPWVTLSCDPKGIIPPQELAKMRSMTGEAVEAKEIAHASGWDLARGEIIPAEGAGPVQKPPGQDQQFPKPKYWVYLGLGIPVLLVIAAVMGIAGILSSPGVGKAMLLLGVGGVVLMLVAASIDYVEDALDQSKEEMAKVAPGGMFVRAMEQSMAEAEDKMKEVLQTEATWYLWGSLALYGLIAGCGVLSLGAEEPAPAKWTESYQAEQTLQSAGIQPGPTTRPAPLAPPSPPTPAGDLPDFGPDVTPQIPSKTNNPATFRRE